MLAAGSMSDRQGRKGTLLLGLAVFASGSLAGALVNTTPDLIAARAVMGLELRSMFPSTLSLLVNVFTERGERAKAIGLWGATTGVGIATGPIVGGWLLERYWWGSIFAFMALVAVAGRGARRRGGSDLAGPADATYRLVRPGAVERRHGNPHLGGH